MMSVGANMSLASLLSTVKNAFIQRKAERSNVDQVRSPTSASRRRARER